MENLEELNLCKHTRLADNCPVCEFEVKDTLSSVAFLDSLPLEFPEEFPEYWKNRNSINAQRKLLNEAEETHLIVSLEGFEGTGHSDNENPYDRSEVTGGLDEA